LSANSSLKIYRMSQPFIMLEDCIGLFYLNGLLPAELLGFLNSNHR
jgi:hypothetical protein